MSSGTHRLVRRWRDASSRVVAIAVLVAGVGGCSNDRNVESAASGTDLDLGRPSIVLLTLDTTRPDHLEPYGARDVRTPSLASLAENGIVFEHAVATAPVTAPAHASLLTGLYPPRHGVRDNSTHRLDGDHTTLAERLAAAGYRTGAFVSTVILDHRYGLDQGFEVYDDDVRSSPSGGGRRLTVERPAQATNDRAIAWLDSLVGDQPFFLWVHYYDPHIPYAPPSPWAESYPERAYAGEIAYMDDQIGRLLRHPRVGDDVVVMAVGDHGEALGEHGEKTHGLLVYDSTLLVPWIVRLPGATSPIRVSDPVSQVDLVPTIMDLLSLDTGGEASGFDGRSLVTLLRGETGSGSCPIFAESEVPFLAYGWARLRSVRQDSLKLIQAPVAELYDLDHDPAETTNLASQRTDGVARLSAMVDTWASAGDTSNGTLDVDTETTAMLRALGYVTGDVGRPEGQGRGNPVELMPVHDELQEVGRLLSSGRPHEAVDRARYALAMDPDNLVALRDLSRGLALTGQLDEAAATAARASTLAPWSARAVAVLADIEFRRGDFERALDLADRALEIDPAFVEARVDRSRFLAALGRTDDAAAELTTLLETSPDDPWVTLRYVELVDLPAGALADAEMRLRAIVSRNPSFVEARLLLGGVLTRAGRPADAVATYREAVVADPTHPEALARLGLLLAELGAPTAEQALRTAIQSNPVPRADLHVALGKLLASRGNSSEARRQLELAAAAPAATADARNAKATALMLLGRSDQAEAMWRDLVEDRPDYASAWTNLASLSIRNRKWADAESFARAAIERDPSSTGAWNTLGIALEELGRTDDAEAAYRRAGELDPGDWQALFNLGILLRTSGRYQEAVDVQQEVLNRSPGNPGAHFELGMLYAGFLGDAERAKLHLQATIDAAPDHPRARQAKAVLDQLH